MSKVVSARQVIKILCRDFGFYSVSQKGSHIKLKKKIIGREIVTIIPFHKELSPGTLKGVLDLAEVDEKDFWKKV